MAIGKKKRSRMFSFTNGILDNLVTNIMLQALCLKHFVDCRVWRHTFVTKALSDLVTLKPLLCITMDLTPAKRML